MTRLIDADELHKKFFKEFDHNSRLVNKQAVARAWQGAMQLLYDAPTIEPKQEWISVKDRLPEFGQKVLVCDVDPDSDYGIKVLSLECDEKGAYWDDDGDWWFEPEDMSHWMPLPEPPEK